MEDNSWVEGGVLHLKPVRYTLYAFRNWFVWFEADVLDSKHVRCNYSVHGVKTVYYTPELVFNNLYNKPGQYLLAVTWEIDSRHRPLACGTCLVHRHICIIAFEH